MRTTLLIFLISLASIFGAAATQERLDQLREQLAAAEREAASTHEEMQRVSRESHQLQSQAEKMERRQKKFVERNALDGESKPLEALQKRNLKDRELNVVDGEALDPTGARVSGRILSVGPLRYFAGVDCAGPLVQRAGSVLPHVAPVSAQNQDAIRRVILSGETDGWLPMDFSGGRAYDQRPQRIWEHFAAGGVLMIPIAIVAWLALMVIVNRLWFYVTNAPRSVYNTIAALPDEDERYVAAQQAVRDAEQWLSALAVCASVAPLLGLLGTVTGMITTFQALAQEGARDIAQLSGGISEALITTEAGLMVAIPALLFHAWARRRVRKLSQVLED